MSDLISLCIYTSQGLKIDDNEYKGAEYLPIRIDYHNYIKIHKNYEEDTFLQFLLLLFIYHKRAKATGQYERLDGIKLLYANNDIIVYQSSGIWKPL